MRKLGLLQVILCCPFMGLIAAATAAGLGSWHKVPYAPNYENNGYRRSRLKTVPIPFEGSHPGSKVLQSRSGYAYDSAGLAYSRTGIEMFGYPNPSFGQWYYDDDNRGIGGSAGSVILLGGGNPYQFQQPPTIQVEPVDEFGYGYEYGGQAVKKSRPVNADEYQKYEKPGFVQKLIPLTPINTGKFSEILNWFGGPYGHRQGYIPYPSHGHSSQGYGWGRK